MTEPCRTEPCKTEPYKTVPRFLIVLLALVLPCQEVFAAAGFAEDNTIEFTTDEGTWISLDVSPDGETLVFELLGDIYRLPVAGGTAMPLLTGRAFQSQPRFSPDGSRLVYISDESGSDNVWLAEDGAKPRALSDLPRALMWSPAWSATGRSIFVTVSNDGGPRAAEIWRYDIESGVGERVVENTNGAPSPLVSSPAPGAYGPHASADGLSLFFTSVTPRPYGSRHGASSSILRHDLASGRSEPVVVDGNSPMKPSLSPDGRYLVYAGLSEGKTGLRVRDLESGAERWLHYPIQRHQLEGRATRDVLPNFAIAPDSSSIFAAFGGKIHRLGLDSTIEGSTGSADHEIVPFAAQVSLRATPTLHFPRRLDTGPVQARRIRHLAFGPAGRVAFSALARIYLTDIDGGVPRRLTATARPRELMPAWSPDGRWVAYVTWDESGGHLWKAPAGRGIAPKCLSAEPALWMDPVWTPDGQAIIALTAPRSSAQRAPGRIPPGLRLVEMPAEGGSPRTILHASGLRRPHFANSSRVYVSSAEGLISIQPDGTDRRLEVSLPRQAGRATWQLSPDGTEILALVNAGLLLFKRPGLPGAELKVADGLVVTPSAATSFSWSADGDSAMWVIGRVLHRYAGGSTQPAMEPLRVYAQRATPSGTVVLRGARVITMRGHEIIEDADVVVTGNRILWLGPRESKAVPTGARLVDVSGKVIVPGFIDVHAHFFPSDDLPQPESAWAFANLAFGVTSLRNPQAPPDIFSLADIVEVDGVASPRIFSTGPGIELRPGGGNFAAPSLDSLDAVRRSLARYRDEYGTHLLKSYLVGNRQQRQWVIEASRELGMMPTTEGGADTKADMTHAIDGFSGNEHAFPVAPIYDDLVQLVAHTGMAYTPTLVVSFGAALPVYRLLAEKRPHENARLSRWFAEGQLYAQTSGRLLWFPPEDYNDRQAAEGARAILEAGGQVALGGHGEVQGLSAHWEMELLAGGGMKPHDVLRVATLFGARALGFEQDLGSVEPGKMADLVVLDRDPLVDIRNTTAIRYVMKNGVLYEAETLDQLWPEERSLTLPWWLAEKTVVGEYSRHSGVE